MEQLNYQPGVQCVYNVSEPLSTLDPVLGWGYEMEGYSNRKMSYSEIITMLDAYSVSWDEVNGKIYASKCGDDYTDVTNYDLFNMLSFLNY